jgi:hypothetical protein
MITLSIAGIAGCSLLLALGVFMTLHEQHPLDFLFGGALALVALAGIAMILHIRPTLYGLIILVCFGIVLADFARLIPERFYFDHRRRHREVDG